MTESQNAGLPCGDATGSGTHRESMVLALRATLKSYGATVGYDELSAVTGTAFMFTCAPEAPDPTWWPAFGRDAFLEPAARSYGLALRDLHPPDAAPLPRTPPEFAIHFRDSYLPFIREAIRRGEPVLAWMGWPPPNELDWGIITTFDEPTNQCHGLTSARPASVPLVGPPVQVYLAQGYAPAQPEPAASLQAALSRAAVVLNNRLDRSYGVITGPASVARWREMAAASLARGNATGLHEAAGICSELATKMVQNRQAAMRFLQNSRDHATPEQSRIIDLAVPLFEEVRACLAPTLESFRLRESLQSERGRGELLSTLDRLIDLERQAAELFRAVGPNAAER